MTKKYWTMLTQSKYGLYYLDAYIEYYVRNERLIKIITAITSSTAIAAWTTWQGLSFWWGLIIVISQVIIAVSEFFPYKKRVKELSDIVSLLKPIYNDMEKEWYYIHKGKRSDEEINDILYNFQQQWDYVLERGFEGDSLPKSEKLMKKAEENTNK